MPTETIDASRLAELFHVLPVGLVLLDREGRVVLANPAEAELFGRQLPIASHYFEGLPAGPELEDLQRLILVSMEGDVVSLDQRRELALNTPSGTLDVVMAARGLPLGGEPHVVLVVQDNSANKRTERALAAALGAAQDQALRDPLTGLFNRRHVESVLPAELKRAERREAPLSLLVMDLDRFKAINDRFGHPTGDRVLEELARLLSRIVRVGDTLARIGGEEFCVILPHSDSAAAVKAADRFHRVIRALRLEEEPDLRLTVSIGAATVLAVPRGDVTEAMRELMARADAALYRAKETGRDRTVADA
jgi:diguanylate cyclase (GGDEF)-like protein